MDPTSEYIMWNVSKGALCSITSHHMWQADEAGEHISEAQQKACKNTPIYTCVLFRILLLNWLKGTQMNDIILRT